VTRITEQLADLQRHIRTAAERAGRDPEGVRILAVSKRQPAKAVREARAAGLSDFGENYVQEALDKIAEVGGDAAWHFIGRIQSNKTRPIAEHFAWVHTVTDRRTAERLSAQRPERMDDLQVCIQVRPLDAGDRAGVEAADVPELAAVIGDLPGIRLRGLMMMPLPGLTDEDTRREYARTRKLLESLREGGCDLDTLSMGMSSDLETAVAEGSTLLRIGTAIFGPRK
jgi:pyridoxal phosphate enzyme (YggS family)